MIIVLARIQTIPGKRDEFLAEFQRLVPEVRAEAGCIEYGPAVDAVTDLPAQLTDADVVMVVEKWESLEALKAHLVAPHMVSYRTRVKDLVAGTQLQVLDPR